MDSAWDVIVIGAGAAGLMAASRAAERGRRTLLLEKNRKPGVKILMSGGTRCNITHATDNRGIVEAFGPPGKFLHSSLAALSVQDTIAFFEQEGVLTKVEETGKVFPVSNKATDVLDALLRRLHKSGATLALGEPTIDMRREEGGISISTPGRTLRAARVILTTGGQSYPGCGTTGDGYGFAARLGHTIVTPRPALVPLTADLPWVTQLRGVTISDVVARFVLPASAKVLATRRGSLLFTHFGLSGPVVLDISRVITDPQRPEGIVLELDLLPNFKEADLIELLRQQSIEAGKKQLAGVLPEELPRRLGETLVMLAGMPADRKAAALSKEERACLVQCIKRLQVPVTGTLGFKKAEVTAGGVSLEEVDSRTLRSRVVPELHIAGELLDLDGPIGGYNFQAAFSTAWLAGSCV